MNTINALSVVREFFFSQARTDRSEKGVRHQCGRDRFVPQRPVFDEKRATPLTPLSDRATATLPAEDPIRHETVLRVDDEVAALISGGGLDAAEMIQRLAERMRSLVVATPAIPGGDSPVTGKAMGSILVAGPSTAGQMPEHLTRDQQFQVTAIAAQLAHLEYVRRDWPKRSSDPGATERLRQEILDAVEQLAGSGPVDLEALGNEMLAAAYPPRFTEIFGQRPTRRQPGETAFELRARQTKWDQDLHHFRGAADVPPGYTQADVDLVGNLTEQWDMGRPVFVEGRYGWTAVFPDSPVSGGMDLYQSNIDSLMRATHVIIAKHQVSMLQDGIRPSMPRHPMVPPQLWDA